MSDSGTTAGRRLLAVAIVVALFMGAFTTWSALFPGTQPTVPKSPQISPYFGSTVAAAADASDDQILSWVGADDRFWYAIERGTSVIWAAPVMVSKISSVGGEPSVTLIEGSAGSVIVWLFWRGDDGTLRSLEGKLAPGAKATTIDWLRGPSVVAGAGSLASQPSATYVSGGKTVGLWVFWKGPHGRLTCIKGVVVGTTVRWPRRPTTVGGTGALDSSPSAGSDASGAIYVYWKGGPAELSNVLEDSRGASGWALRAKQLPFTGDTGSGPSVAVSPSGEQWLYWQGLDHNLWTAEWTGTAWLHSQARSLGSGPLNSAPAATFCLRAVEVFWRGSDQNIWTVASTPPYGTSWTTASDIGDGPVGGF